MPFTQETFFGASIRNWQSSIGWEGNPASCTVNVVVDLLNGDSFVTPIIGMPATMQYQTWSFRGLVESYKRKNSSDANPEYEIKLVDPREILANAQVIVGEYAGGTYGVPNLYNPYGYYESFGYGNSGYNEVGMPYQIVRAGIELLVASSPLSLKGYSYIVDLSQLPTLSVNYRVQGPSMSILDFVSQICQDGGHDFFINLVGNIITVRTISRLNIPASFNEINTFISTVGGQVSSEVGRELRNETTSKVIVGGQKIECWFQPYNGLNNEFATIWPFWGFLPTGQAILGTGINNAHEFTVDITHTSLGGFSSTYTTNVEELRAALSGYADWEFYILSKRPATAVQVGMVGHVHKKVKQLIQKAPRAPGGGGADLDQLDGQNGPRVTPRQLLDTTADALISAASAAASNFNTNDERSMELYRVVKGYADTYYGKQFMVSIPGRGPRVVPETGEVDVGYDLEPSGWISNQGTYAALIASGYLPANFFKASDDSGKFKCMARISDYTNYDLSEIPEEDLVISGTYAFVVCDVVGMCFLDPVLYTGLKAVIRLPAPIRVSVGNTVGELSAQLRALMDDTTAPPPFVPWTAVEKAKFQTMPGIESISSGLAPFAILPDLAIVPLRDKLYTYGPWVAIGANGKVDFEANQDLVPWNYGSDSALSVVANAMASSAITYMQESESGSVEYPGVPTTGLGVPIVAGGPYVTDVSVSIGENGATTRYTMKTWSPRFGQVAKKQLETTQRLIKSQQKLRTQIRNIIAKSLENTKHSKHRASRKTDSPPRRSSNSSHTIITSQYIVNDTVGEIPLSYLETAFQSPIDNVGQISQSYEYKGGVSLDAIFRPFCANTPGEDGTISNQFLPTMEEGNNGIAEVIIPVGRTLNHFSGEHDIQCVFRGTSVPTRGMMINTRTDSQNPYDDPLSDEALVAGSPYDDNMRPVGFRGPISVVGWGMDCAGYPVPNQYVEGEGPADQEAWIEDYKRRSNTWKVGPVDLRWDEDRNLWVSDHQHLEGYLNQDIAAGGTGMMSVWRKDLTGNYVDSGEDIALHNLSSSRLSEDSHIVAIKINREWRPIVGATGDASDASDCYKGMGQDVPYDEFECANWTDDNGDPIPGVVEDEQDTPTVDEGGYLIDANDEQILDGNGDPILGDDANHQQFTCGDDYMNTFEFVTDVYCIDEDIVVCTRKICLPNSWVSVEDCGDSTPPEEDCCENDFALCTSLNASWTYVSGPNPFTTATSPAPDNPINEDFVLSHDAVGTGHTHVGNTVTGGGSMWTITLSCDETNWTLTFDPLYGTTTTKTVVKTDCTDGQVLNFGNITFSDDMKHLIMCGLHPGDPDTNVCIPTIARPDLVMDLSVTILSASSTACGGLNV